MIESIKDLFRQSAAAEDPEAAFEGLWQAFCKDISNIFFDVAEAEKILADLKRQKISRAVAIYRIALEATGFSVLFLLRRV